MQAKNITSILRTILLLLATLPALYVFVAIQYSAITVPFWDHVEIFYWISAWYDGSFHFSSLWTPHNHTRPLVYRLVMLANALLTDWDIRSEYIYIYLAIYGAFASHVLALKNITSASQNRYIYPIVLLLISIFLFSPVGHNNHWWSMMFQLNAANLFITIGLLIPFLRPKRLGSHVAAFVSCGLATFTLTNGFFAMVALALVFQLSATSLLRPTRWFVFWGGGLLLLLLIYMPGITLSIGSSHPTLLQLVQFSLAYLGAPLSGLFWFPYQNMFDIPMQILPNAICGAILLLSYGAFCWHARVRLREQHSAAMILFGFGIFSIVSALATGWGRAAFDEFGVASGNSSRYTIFSAYLILGQLYYIAAGFAHGWWSHKTSVKSSQFYVLLGVGVFVFLSIVSYVRALPVYLDAHRFNKSLFNAYPWGLEPTLEDKSIHPNPESVNHLKRELQRLELGPYSNRPFSRAILPIGQFKKAGLLSRDRKLVEQFTATENGFKAVSVTLVTPNGKQTTGTVNWEVTEIGLDKTLASGKIDAVRINDWSTVRLKLPYIEASKGRSYKLTLSSKADDAHGLGVALYAPVLGQTGFTINEQFRTSNTEELLMALQIEYAK